MSTSAQGGCNVPGEQSQSLPWLLVACLTRWGDDDVHYKRGRHSKDMRLDDPWEVCKAHHGAMSAFTLLHLQRHAIRPQDNCFQGPALPG